MTTYADPWIPPSDDLCLRALNALHELKTEGEQTVSICFFQRRFRLGYTNARKLAETLASQGYIERAPDLNGPSKMKILLE